ncbi:hypothetical protein ABMC89_18105 [Sulfitobacter sp. HNIBRBA3233]|uniref:hypothetical protein n=1 Tax=Sulfitobacter marinivivus TaxID=3158558 RepID=UPI0032DE2E10
MSTDDLTRFDEKFRVETLLLADTGGWALSLRPGQTTLGATVLSVRSGARDLAALTGPEASGMAAGFGLAERLSREVFGAVRINILCLMMQDPIVHFHILPRYDREIDRYGRTWVDADWPGPPVITADPAPDGILQAIRKDLRAVR